MTRLVDSSMVINIIGLAVVNAAEAWRPGSISGAVNIGLIWLGAVLLLAFSYWWKQKLAE